MPRDPRGSPVRGDGVARRGHTKDHRVSCAAHREVRPPTRGQAAHVSTTLHRKGEAPAEPDTCSFASPWRRTAQASGAGCAGGRPLGLNLHRHNPPVTNRQVIHPGVAAAGTVASTTAVMQPRVCGCGQQGQAADPVRDRRLDRHAWLMQYRRTVTGVGDRRGCSSITCYNVRMNSGN
jgi:hypothetical protein